MKSYEEMTKEELLKEKEGLEAEYKKFQQRGLKLDMSRGKPSQEQLDLSMGMMDVLTSGVDLTCDDGTDCRRTLWGTSGEDADLQGGSRGRDPDRGRSG